MGFLGLGVMVLGFEIPDCAIREQKSWFLSNILMTPTEPEMLHLACQRITIGADNDPKIAALYWSKAEDVKRIVGVHEAAQVFHGAVSYSGYQRPQGAQESSA
jgi:hypothetical protein